MNTDYELVHLLLSRKTPIHFRVGGMNWITKM